MCCTDCRDQSGAILLSLFKSVLYWLHVSDFVILSLKKLALALKQLLLVLRFALFLLKLLALRYTVACTDFLCSRFNSYIVHRIGSKLSLTDKISVYQNSVYQMCVRLQNGKRTLNKFIHSSIFYRLVRTEQIKEQKWEESQIVTQLWTKDTQTDSLTGNTTLFGIIKHGDNGLKHPHCG